VSDTAAVDQPLAGGYVSDLLSHVMGQAKAGQVWVTMQGHQNIVAVASLVGLGAVIVTSGVEPEEQTVNKAIEQEVALCMTKLSTYEVAGRLYQLDTAEK
jgi:predicted transcriptional regulator